jgi:hypothetical protein
MFAFFRKTKKQSAIYYKEIVYPFATDILPLQGGCISARTGVFTLTRGLYIRSHRCFYPYKGVVYPLASMFLSLQGGCIPARTDVFTFTRGYIPARCWDFNIPEGEIFYRKKLIYIIHNKMKNNSNNKVFIHNITKIGGLL